MANRQQRDHLLVVAPEKKMRDSVSNQLEQLGYKVTVVADEYQVMDILASSKTKESQAQAFDLMILSADVPEIDCRRLLNQLEADRILRHIARLVITKRDEVDKGIQYMELGVEDYLPLPFNPVLWKARIEANLDKKRLYDQQQTQVEKVKNTILPLLIDLSKEKDLDRLLEGILVEAKSICNADAGTLYLKTEDDCLEFIIMRTDSLNIVLGGTTGQVIPFPPLRLYDETGNPNDHNVATYVALHRQLVNIPDVYHAEDFDFSATKSFDEKNSYRSISSLTVPLKNHLDEVLGVLQLFNAQDPETGQVVPFGAYEQLVVESLASQAAVILNNQMLLQSQQEWLKFERDLHIGHRIQVDFLPKELPEVSGWEIAARFHPAREVAGDFYDAFTLPSGKLGLVIADVCDKGVGPALFMALSRTLIRAFAEQHRPLSWMEDFDGEENTTELNIDRKKRRMLLSAGLSALLAVELTNNYILDKHGNMNMFVTLFFGVLDPNTGVLTYVSGGHDPPAIIGPDGVLKTRLMPTGPAVGIFPDSSFDIEQVKLEPGDLLIGYSDGVPDAQNPDGKRFTEEHFLSLLEQPFPSVVALLDHIESNLFAHIADADQFDDITMLAVRRS